MEQCHFSGRVCRRGPVLGCETEATDAKNKDGITVATIYVQPPAGVDSCKSNCYPAADYLRDKIASPGQASEYDWDNIAQSVGNLADKILAKLC